MPDDVPLIGDTDLAFAYNGNMSSVDRLFEEAKQLPLDQRLTLVSRLLRSDEGKALSRPAGEVFSDLDRRLKP